MNLFFTQLFALTQGVAPASGATPGLLADLRRFLTAVLIQQNGALAPLAAEAQADPETNAAAVAGVALAAERTAVGVRLRFARGPYLGTPVDAARPIAVLGPFVDADLVLLRHSFAFCHL